MKIHLTLLPTDWMLYALLVACIIFVIIIKHHPHLKEPWKQIFRNRLGMIAFIILLFYIAIGLLDSIHLEIIQKISNKQQITRHATVFDLLTGSLGQQNEKTYSEPFAIYTYQSMEIMSFDHAKKNNYYRLQYAGTHLKNENDHKKDIILRIIAGFLSGLLSFLLIAYCWIILLSHHSKISFRNYLKAIIKGKTEIAWREAMITFGILWIFIFIVTLLGNVYHIFGTDKIGQDVFYETVKSIRTGIIIGTLTTIIMLPFALSLGMIAGYFGGIIDDVIQFFYTTLSSIPSVLLISAMVLVLQVYIANHPHHFPTIESRADARLLALCFILGITSWASLCRLLRAETLKLREQDFITASIAMGSRAFNIIFRHILPNIMHIVLITTVLDFSGLVLAESILSYVGVGVDPTTASWGNIINTSRLELAREPIVWWPLMSALMVMFFLVLSANIFADAVRDAFDPRLRKR